MLAPAGARTVIAVSAPFTAGKSTLVKAWAQSLHRHWLGDVASDSCPRWAPEPGLMADWVPVVHLSLQSESRSRDLYAQILGFIGNIKAAESTETRMALQTTKSFGLHQIRLLIIDDAHMLRTSSITGRATLNAVKHLNTTLGEHGGVLVLVGAHISGGEALSDPQIRGRLSEHTVAPYAIDTPAGRRDWQRLLRGLEEMLSPYLPGEPPGYLARHHAAYLWSRTQGFVGDTATVVIDAATAALATGEPLGRAHFDAVRLSGRAQDQTARAEAMATASGQ